MSLIDQNNALKSLGFNLENNTRLIDGRTENDDLNFLVEFASLINFYDKNNAINGDWAPFLLKDPIFLLATIAKTPFKKMHSLFVQTCIVLEETLKVNKETSKIPIRKRIASVENAMNQLFNQLMSVFQIIEKWVGFMIASTIEYNLKSFLIKEVKEKYSQFLWAILWLRDQLHSTKSIKGITPVKKSTYQLYDTKVWKQNEGKVPYYELLNLKYPLEDNTEIDFFYCLKNTGELLFSFFNSIIEYAPVESLTFQEREDIYPDTLLLQTFTQLMKIYKNQLNGLSKKHLNFYYKNILLQKKQEAVADSVFVSANLSEVTSTYNLLKGTLFNGGEYQDKLPVLYKAIQDVSLNPATITNVYTLSKTKKTAGFANLYLKKEEVVNEVQEDEAGKIKQWKTFGSQKINEGEKVTLGFAIASPMLLLKEGVRELTLTFVFSDKKIDLEFFKKGTYYLSTEEAWYEIPKTAETLQITRENSTIKFVVNLDKTAPAIIPFTENPDGLEATWPMFKMCYTQLKKLANPPTIKSIKIEVNVKELQTFQLYNDFGLLESEKPFQLLGPTPEKDQSFIIGNAEVFSKPVTTFSMLMDWNNLPENFSNYYYQYNRYLNGGYTSPEFGEEISTINKIIFFLTHLFKEIEEDKPVEIVETGVFNDMAFTVDFQLLQEKLWLPINMNMLFAIRDLFFIDKDINGDDVNYLFQGYPEIINLEKRALKKVICIKNQLKIDQLLKIQDTLQVHVDCKIGDALKLEDDLELEGLLKIESRAVVSDIIKIKEVAISYVFEKESTIKLCEVFEINQYLKADEFFLINGEFSIKNTLTIEEYFKNHKAIIYKENTAKYHLKLSDELKVNSILKVCDVFVLNQDILLKDALGKRIEELITIKSDIKMVDLLSITTKDLNITKGFDFKGEFFYTNAQDEPCILDVSGSLKIKNELQVTSIVNLHDSLFLFETITMNKNKKTLVNANYKTLFANSEFGTSEILASQKNIDPNIQNTPLEYTETTSSGFIKMKLKNPKEGFGVSLYPKVVAAIAMYNAEILVLMAKNGEDKYILEEPANEPFTPVVGFFKGNYTSSCTYEYNTKTGSFESLNIANYPITCFYYTAFKNYKVYDSSFTIKENNTIKNGFPAILSEYKGEGQLILGLEEVIAPAEISFYFELAQDATTVYKEKNEITYQFLGEKGWQELPIVSDTTNGFSCSGIITFDVLSTITNVNYTMPNDFYWIAIHVANNPDWYAQTTFLQTNGIILQRTGTAFKTSSKKPVIKANTIESTYEAVPEIGSVVQPFSSFGGKAYETEALMNKRVSVRLKTKDRVVTGQDYYRVIKEAFNEIYFVKVFYNRKAKKTEVYVVKNIENWKNSNAFLPLVSCCLQQEVQDFIVPRASKIANVEVHNFNFKYVKIVGEITIKKGNKPTGVAKLVNNGINIFLSPWIETKQAQIVINKGVSVAQIAEFIKSYDCIDSIKNLDIYLGEKNIKTGVISYGKKSYQNINPDNLLASNLLVPSLNDHKISYM